MEFIAFDLETTGRIPGVDRICEIGFVKFEKGEVVDRLTMLIDPEIAISPQASKVNGISQEMVKGKPLIKNILDKITEFCGEFPLIAHNAPFDYGFLVQDFKKFGRPTPKGVVIDTLPLSRNTYPSLLNFKLATVAQFNKLDIGTLHRADDDAALCGEVFIKIVEQHFNNGDVDWPRLIKLTGRDPVFFPEVEKQPEQLTLL